MTQLEKIKETQKEAVKPPKMWKIGFLNDDFTSFEFVMGCLMEIFKKSYEEAHQITLSIHKTGKGIIGVYTKDIAESKQKMTMDYAMSLEFPLQVFVEEA